MQEEALKVKHRVYYYETDRMGRVYHSNFVNWMEEARTEFIRNKDINYKEMEDRDGIILPIREVNLKYYNPVEYDENVVIETSITKLTRVKIEFNYKFYNEDMTILFGEASSVNIFADKAGKPIRVSKSIIDKIGGETFE